MTDLKSLFDAVREIKGEPLTQADVDAINRALAPPVPPVPAVPATQGALNVRAMLELCSHEAIIQEAYKDSEGVWTWSAGITSASGHSVERYKDNPQTMAKCLEIFVWLVREKYLPAVIKAFEGRTLTEAQLAAALSFHWNTGAIGRASWVKSFMGGQPTTARREFMEWNKPAAIIERRQHECDLFFDGRWSGDGKVTVYQVRKPSYAPNWGSAKRVDISNELGGLL